MQIAASILRALLLRRELMLKKFATMMMPLVLSLAGCAAPNLGPRGIGDTTSKTFTVQRVRDAAKSAAQLDEENRRLLEAKLQEVLDFCQPRLSGFEQSSASQAKKAYWLSMSGLVAGSVIAPALTSASAASNAAWISALSGWGGATNFAGQALRTSGLSGTTIAETRNGIIKNVRDAITVASDGTKSFDDRRDALMRARSECILYEIAVPTIAQNE